VPPRVVVGSFTPSVLLAVARRTGRLTEQELEVEERPVPSSPAQFRSLLDGELQVAFTSPDNVLAYRFDPENPLGALADVRIVATVDRGMGLGLYGRPGLENVDGAAGLVFGVDVPTSGFALAMYALAESLGVPRDQLEIAVLGSTPNRLRALISGGCDLTMLNAGNELLAEAAGCRRLAGVAEVCGRYVGTVLAVHGETHLPVARRLAAALAAAVQDIRTGAADELAASEAIELLGLPDRLAKRYVDRLRTPEEGLIGEPGVDYQGLETVVALRRRFLPRVVKGHDVLEGALEDRSGLVAAGAARA
jgi:ABC-type nitrate/sulfonate/bicarbonate transport system substrate-binding protein